MASNYDLITTSSTVQVLSPTVTQPVVDCTVKTKPHGVIFDYWLDKLTFDNNQGAPILEAVCAGVEHIMASEPVIAGVGNQQLDASGLLEQNITFTVAYTPPGSTTGPATVDVDVPVGDFGQDAFAGTNFGLQDAEARINEAYNNLKGLA